MNKRKADFCWETAFTCTFVIGVFLFPLQGFDDRPFIPCILE